MWATLRAADFGADWTPFKTTDWPMDVWSATLVQLVDRRSVRPNPYRSLVETLPPIGYGGLIPT